MRQNLVYQHLTWYISPLNSFFMANVQATDRSGSSHGNPVKPIRANRISTRIDFTPMVDLGFLLITFFMLTTALTKPNVMPMVMPKTGELSEPLKASKALTLLLGDGDKIYWYEGLEMAQMDSTSFDAAGLRKLILDKKNRVDAQWGLESFTDSKTGASRNGSFLSVIIKASKHARYKNLIDALDEMAICQVRYYCLLDITAEEASLL